MSGPSIDWEDLRRGYNHMFKTEHRTVRDMVLELYQDTKSLSKSSEILGVSRPTFGKKVRMYGIIIEGKGGKNHKGVICRKFLEISAEKMATMTKLEIMEACGNSSDTYTGKLIKKHNRSFKKVLNNGRHYGKF